MKSFFCLLALFLTLKIQSQNTVQSPETFLSYPIGSQFTRHHKVIDYFEHIANSSSQVTLHHYGMTNEKRPLTYAIITSPENHQNIDNIRLDNLKNIGIEKGNSNPETAIIWLSYNVHGNEASATEAAMQTAYKLITEKQDWLKNTVIIIDPCVNPDGKDRYTNWYNQVKSTPYTTDQNATEHNEPWPGGRPNHYLFDLNRDWAWATQVESSQRLKVYNQWMPHIHVDFHEQGINDPYYFAPAAAPFHEIITPWQKQFQTEIGKNHAKYFDQEGWLFFTRESFDLLYPSYGDTYPTFMGAIGMTYEQAGHGRAGLGIETDEGYILTLKDRAKHHTTTGISTIEIASKNAKKINTEFKKFFDNSTLKYKSYILKGEKDKLQSLTQLLDKHQIAYGYTNNTKVAGFHYQQNKQSTMDSKGALVVSTNQPKGKMVKVLFEPNAKLSNPITYDITAWSLPYAYGLETIASTSLVPISATKADDNYIETKETANAGYITKWNSIKDAAFLADLIKNKIRVRFSEKDFTNNGTEFPKGSLIITKSDQAYQEDYPKKLLSIAKKHQRKLHIANSSFADKGIDFGSYNIKLINEQRIAVLKGKYTNSLNYGEIWHFFEQQLQYPITSIDCEFFKKIALDKYDVLIIPDGEYTTFLDSTQLQRLKKWIQQGGKVIALSGALSSFADKSGFELQSIKNKKKDSTSNLIPYDQREKESLKKMITGSIFKTKVDNTHPIAFGYPKTYFSLKLGNKAYKTLTKGFNICYIQTPENISGYAGEKALSGLTNSLVFGSVKIGKGNIVYMVDNPLFRSFWENGKLFFVNAIFKDNPPRFKM